MTQHTPPPLSGLAGILSIVPRWLIIAASIVLLAWTSFEIYINARINIAQVRQVEAQSCETRMHAMGHVQRGDTIGKVTPEEKKWKQDCAQYLPSNANETASNSETNPPQKDETTADRLTQIRKKLKGMYPGDTEDEINKISKNVCWDVYKDENCKP
jgi:hypothetical protein